MIFRPIPVYFQSNARFYFQSNVSIFSLVIYRGFAFSWFLYIQRVTCNPGFSACSADCVYIACICASYFQSNIRTFLDDIPLPGLFLDEIMAIFRSNSQFYFQTNTYFQPHKRIFSSDHQLYRVFFFWFSVGFCLDISYNISVNKKI